MSEQSSNDALVDPANGRDPLFDELAALITRHETAVADDPDNAQELRLAFLRHIREVPDLLEDEALFHFLAYTVEPEDFLALNWEEPEQMLDLSDSLYRLRFEDRKLSRQVNRHVQALLRQALHEYEKAGELEKMFRLLTLSPTFLTNRDEELSRLYHRANSYEFRRVRKNRRWLYTYLIIQLFLIVLVFPFLFINAENGYIQRQVEELTDVELGDDGYRLIPYSTGLYWTIVTATSVGYGDITPLTDTGRIIAAMLGTMGVITVGILAGLVLDWITPRRLD